MSAWLGISPPAGADVQLNGSPVDAFVFQVLLLAGIIVLARRAKRSRALLARNWPILVYFFYCLVSVSWAYYPDVSLKKWIKAISDLVMVLIIVTDKHPVAAFTRLITRVGFLLLPASILLIKYYGDLGRGYTPDGTPMNTGVTTNKNSLGLIVLVVSLGALWSVRTLLMHKYAPNRRRRLIAQGTLLAFGLALLQMAGCATCISCFILGSGFMLVASLRSIRIRPARVHALCLAIVLVGSLAFFSGGEAYVIQALGRKPTLSGRTYIWAAVISAVPNPIVGAGFESFWISPAEKKVAQSLSGWWQPQDLNEAHDGYLETYANLGWIGVCLIVIILITGYRRAAEAFQRDPELGSLVLAYIVIAPAYNITEAGFRSLDLAWIFLLYAVVSASGVMLGPLAAMWGDANAAPDQLDGRSAAEICSFERP